MEICWKRPVEKITPIWEQEVSERQQRPYLTPEIWSLMTHPLADEAKVESKKLFSSNNVEVEKLMN